MQQKYDYKVITDSVHIPDGQEISKIPNGVFPSNLVTRVNQEMISGYKPCGLTSFFDQSFRTMIFYQALVKEG